MADVHCALTRVAVSSHLNRPWHVGSDGPHGGNVLRGIPQASASGDKGLFASGTEAHAIAAVRDNRGPRQRTIMPLQVVEHDRGRRHDPVRALKSLSHRTL